LPLLGDDGGYIPPQQELASRGMVQNVVGYSVFGDFSKPNPPADLIRAVARREVDVAIAWGPLAGYFSRNSDVPLKISPICANTTNPGLPLTFSISMRVSSGQKDLLSQLNAEIERRSHEIRTLLRAYGVPLLDAPFITRSCK
jgi:mxaJ protein